MRSALARVITSLAAHKGLNVTETDVGLTGILIFKGTGINGCVVAYIFPRATANHFLFLAGESSFLA